MSKTSKTVTMLVTVRCPSWLPAAAARREVRSLINNQAFYGTSASAFGVEIDESNFRATKVRSA